MLQMHEAFKYMHLPIHQSCPDQDAFYYFDAPNGVQKRKKRNRAYDEAST